MTEEARWMHAPSRGGKSAGDMSAVGMVHLLDRFESLLDRLEGLLRSIEGTGVAGPSPVLDEAYLKAAREAADKYIKRRKWEMAKERGEESVEADLA